MHKMLGMYKQISFKVQSMSNLREHKYQLNSHRYQIKRLKKILNDYVVPNTCLLLPGDRDTDVDTTNVKEAEKRAIEVCRRILSSMKAIEPTTMKIIELNRRHPLDPTRGHDRARNMNE